MTMSKKEASMTALMQSKNYRMPDIQKLPALDREDQLRFWKIGVNKLHLDLLSKGLIHDSEGFLISIYAWGDKSTVGNVQSSQKV